MILTLANRLLTNHPSTSMLQVFRWPVKEPLGSATYPVASRPLPFLL